jgi:hypothetical protein
MLITRLKEWWRTERRALAFGLAAGLVWGGLTAATVAPRAWLVWDQVRGAVYAYSAAGALVQAQPAEAFFREHNALALQVTLLLLPLAGLAGWATLQLTRVRPRGQPQPPLRAGSDWYLIALAVGGLAAVLVFQWLGLGAWFRGDPPTPLASLTAVVEIVLPLYMGVALFLTWLRRLPSLKPPDWETRYPRRTRRGAGGAGWRRWLPRKGGEPPTT